MQTITQFTPKVNRESDGRFSLQLKSKAAAKRYEAKVRRDSRRSEQVVAQNASFMASVGMNADEARWLFA